MRRKVLVRQHVQRLQDLRPAHGPVRRQQIEEGPDRLRQRLGLLLALDHDQQRPLRELPQQHRIERLGGDGQAGKARLRRVLVLDSAHEFLKRGLPSQALEQIADRGVGQSGCVPAGRFRISSTIPVVE